MVVIVGLPLKEWPKLGKFTTLRSLRIAEETAYQVGDEHIKALCALKLSQLSDISFAYCTNVTDAGIEALTEMPSIKGLQLINVGITDQGMRILAKRFPKLEGINVEGCQKLTTVGFLSLTNSMTMTDVGLSLDPFSQPEIECIVSAVTNVTWWSIHDPQHHLERSSLLKLGGSRGLTIQVSDENHYVTTITLAGKDISMRKAR